MNRCRDALPAVDPLDQGTVADVSFDEREARTTLEQGRVGAFEARVVEVVEVVQDHDLATLVEQPDREMRADESGAAGDENLVHTYLPAVSLAPSWPGAKRSGRVRRRDSHRAPAMTM